MAFILICTAAFLLKFSCFYLTLFSQYVTTSIIIIFIVVYITPIVNVNFMLYFCAEILEVKFW